MSLAEHIDTSRSGCTVLVVDDEPFNVDLMTQELDDLGYNSITAGNGQEALQALETADCDIVLLDIMMPVMNGFEFLEQLNREDLLASLPVIVVSAMDDIDCVARCLELGAEDHLVKPFDPVLLRARIGGALDKKRLRDQVARQLQATREIFGKFVPKGIAQSILDGGGCLAPSLTEASILYCDIEGFTSLVESMAPVQTLSMLNDYFAAVLGPVQDNGGVVNQFLGDAMLVTFNVPLEDLRHRDQAVKTAVEIQALLAERRFADVPLKTRIGINSGPVVAGNISAGDRLHYTVLGDTVNVAARLETLNKKYGTNTLVSGSTASGLHGDFSLEALGEAQIRGKTEPVEVFSIAEQVTHRLARH